MVKKLNKKGFTLVELLAVIAIIALVLGLTSFGVINVLNNSKSRSLDISVKSIKSSARVYGTEKSGDNGYWKNISNYDSKVFCITIEELINRGLLNKDGNLPENILKTDYVALKKNKVTYNVNKGDILNEEDIKSLPDGNEKENLKTMFEICNGTIMNEDLDYPEIYNDTIKTKTDQINFQFKDAKCKDHCDGFSINKDKNECLYGDTSGNLEKKGIISGNTCIIPDSNKNEKISSGKPYYVRICQTTSNNQTICSKTESISTAVLKKPTISSIANNKFKIQYNNTDVNKPLYYFKSTADASSNLDVKSCTLKDNIFTCSSTNTKTISKNTWYITSSQNIELTYTNSGTGTITARITDGSGNYLDAEEKFTIKNKIEYYLGNNSSTSGATKLSDNSCTYGTTCKLKSWSDFGKNVPYSDKGWIFAGWTTSTSGTNVVYNNNSNISPAIDVATTKLYAVFSRSITFYSGINKSSSSTSIQYYNPYCYDTTNCTSYYTSITSFPTAASINGWTYQGYALGTSADSTLYTTNFRRNPASDNKAYAIYSRNVSINYNANGGSGTVSSSTATQKYNSNGDINSVNLTLKNNNYSYTGYSFVSWGTSSSSTSGTAGGSTYAFSPTVDGSTTKTLYAIWNPITYKVHYNGNGNTGEKYTTNCNDSNVCGLARYASGTVLENNIFKHNGVYTYNVDKVLQSNSFNRTGYTFKNWNTKSDGTGTSYENKATVKNLTSSNGAIVNLYAIWNKNMYTITLDKQSGSGGTSTIYENYGSNFSLDSSGSPKMLTDTNPIAKPTRKGYTFDGYYTEKDGGGSQIISASGYIKSGMYSTFTSNSTIYAKWRLNQVHIKYKPNSSDATLTSTTTTSSGTVYKWKLDTDGTIMRTGANNTTYTSYIQKINYGSATDSDGLSNYNNSKYLEIKRSHYSAVPGAEWTCLSGCTTSGKTYDHSKAYNASDFCDASNGDCTVVIGVNWRLNQVHVRYNTNGGSIATTSNSNGTWAKSSSNYVYRNGSLFEQTISYGNSSDPWNYNNSNGINITRSGYKGVSGSEWLCTSGCSEDKKVFNQDTSYASTTYCNAANGDCTIVLSVNWVQDCTTYYVIEPDGLNCRNGASTSYGIKTVFTCGSSLRVCSSATNGWYYDSNKGCYVSGTYISKSRPSSCAQTGGGSTVSCSSYRYCVSSNRIGDDSCMSYSNFAGSSAGACFIYNPCNCPSNFTGTNSCEDRTGRGGC